MGTTCQHAFAYFDTGTTRQLLGTSFWGKPSVCRSIVWENHKDGAMKGSVGQSINVSLHSKILELRTTTFSILNHCTSVIFEIECIFLAL